MPEDLKHSVFMFRPALFRSWLCAAMTAVLSVSVPAPAAEGAVNFTNVAQVLALGRTVSRDSNFTARFTGVVTHSVPGRQRIAVQEGSNTIVVVAGGAVMARGTMVEAEGWVAPGEFGPILERARVKVTGMAPVPVPLAARHKDLSSGKHHGRYVSFRGAVRDMVASGGLLSLLLSEGELTFQAELPVRNDFKIPRDWADAVVELQGVCWTAVDGYGLGYAFTIQGMGTNDLRVIRPGRTNVFVSELLGTADAARAATNTEARVRVKGVVTQYSTSYRSVYIEAEGVPVIVQPLRSLRRSSSVSDALPTASPPVRPGDIVEVVGVPKLIVGRLRLDHSEWRSVGRGVVPAPVVTTPKEVLSGRWWHRVVTLQARVVNRTTARSGPLMLEQVFLEADGLFFTAIGDLPPGALKVNRAGHVELTDLVMSQMRQWDPPHTFMMMLRNADDLRYIAPPRWWQRAEARQAALGAAAVSLLAGGWILWQRRQVNRLRLANRDRRAAEEELRELNSKLEEHVIVRTRELAEANARLRGEVASLGGTFWTTASDRPGTRRKPEVGQRS